MTFQEKEEPCSSSTAALFPKVTWEENIDILELWILILTLTLTLTLIRGHAGGEYRYNGIMDVWTTEVRRGGLKSLYR